MLGIILRDRLKERGLSARDAAPLTGVSHGTIDRVIKGEEVDIDTLVKLCNWLDISPSTILDTRAISGTSVVASVAALIEAEPNLKNLFTEAISGLKKGELESKVLTDIFYYATFRIRVSRKIDLY